MNREKVKQWFVWGLWTENMVADAVKKGKLSPSDYQYITGSEMEE